MSTQAYAFVELAAGGLILSQDAREPGRTEEGLQLCEGGVVGRVAHVPRTAACGGSSARRHCCGSRWLEPLGGVDIIIQ